MKKKILLIVFCYLVSAICYQSSAIFAAERAVISVIFSSDIEPYQQCWQGFREFLEEKNVALWVSEHNLEKDKPEIISSKINKKNPDIVFTLGTKASKLAKEKIKDIPIIFSMVLNPELIIGPNITGVSMDIAPAMKLSEIKKILPEVKRIGLVYSPKTTPLYKEISEECKEFGFQLIGRKVDSGKEFPDALKEICWQIDCFFMITDSEIYFSQSVEYLLLESLRKKFPVIGLSSFYTKAGALISFDCDYKDLGKQAGEIALKIVDGEKPANVQPSRPRKIKLSLNLITAERLDIKIPPAIIKEASEVFDK